MRNAKVTICGRKEPGYPQVKFEIPFEAVDDLNFKIDLETEKLGWRKVDVYIEPEGFTGEEVEKLESLDCIVSNFY